MTKPLDLDDFIGIHQLIALYGHIVDAREWHRVDELFTADGIFDMSGLGTDAVRGPEEIARLWSSQVHPVAHMATNMVITANGKNWNVLSKGFGYWPDSKVGSIIYRDVVEHREAGYRLASRVVSPTY